MRLPGPLDSVAKWFRDIPVYFSRRELAIGAIGVAVIGGGVALALIAGGDEPDDPGDRVVSVVTTAPAPEEGERDAGFSPFATRNTTRIPGKDPATDAAAVALATHPSTEEADPTEAVMLVDSWQSGLAAAVLTGEPLRAPILIGESGGVPEVTSDALKQLKPRGGSGPTDTQVYRVGDVEVPGDYEATDIRGDEPAEIADAVDELRQKLTGIDPEHVVVVSEESPEFAMPAASWAARSGDPVLFSGRDSVPEATIAALRRHPRAQIYVLGPPSAISEKALRQLERAQPGVKRISGSDPVANAIEFARFADASFGWNINDPGHGLVIANPQRPEDAGAAAPLSASGKWGPLLLTNDRGGLPDDLRQFLLDIQPGFRDDPTRAVYNHVWVIGDESAITGATQAEIDELSELVKIGGAAEDDEVVAQPGRPEQTPPPGAGQKQAP